jgi:hypothetical protein
MQNTFEKSLELCGVYFLVKKLHTLLNYISGSMIAKWLHGVWRRHVRLRFKSATPVVKLATQTKGVLPYSSYRSAKLLRRDLRNKSLFFKVKQFRK